MHWLARAIVADHSDVSVVMRHELTSGAGVTSASRGRWPGQGNRRRRREELVNNDCRRFGFQDGAFRIRFFCNLASPSRWRVGRSQLAFSDAEGLPRQSLQFQLARSSRSSQSAGTNLAHFAPKFRCTT